MRTIIAEIEKERSRQKKAEGWSHNHDDAHTGEELAKAAACYAAPSGCMGVKMVPECWDEGRSLDDSPRPIGRVKVPAIWPWDGQWWKPKDRRRDLIRAAALIVAEIERLDRAALPTSLPEGE